MNQRLYRSNNERMLLGVCGGIAERFGLDPTLVRLAFALLFFTGPGLIVYLISALIIPRAPELGAGAQMRAIQHGRSSSLSQR
ncbi:DNA-binding transcriptional activator PspC [Enhygromyxa salina]|uniref:DNA-binding transcriptional activator PspC n=1 Tax=Enhygromyxa salina TaxID=215803 RepID=A0A2S9Y1S9_9BACT|nr:PspC domain-containing protein [Enhygromyxa salina]PRP99068.1 DNA-binding transcriptional activator PspC [Enhygromyxa salina]